MKLKLFALLSVALFCILGIANVNAQTNYSTKGKAKLISGKLDNKATYSGEIYQSDNLIAAHLTLPFGSLLEVRNLKNGKQVTVKVVERGPFNCKAVIGLSNEVFELLELSDNNEVVLTYLGKSAINETEKQQKVYYLLNTQKTMPKGYGVQVASFCEKDNIFAVADSLKKGIDENIFVQVYKKEQTFYRLIIGDMSNLQDANTLCNNLKEEFPGCFVINFLSYE